MRRSQPALINAEVLSWARKAARLDLVTAARAIPVSPEKLQTWEERKAHPTIKQLRKLAKKYKQPFAAFYLPTPPAIPEHKLRDYRRMPGNTLDHLSYELTIDIRETLAKREIALELYQESGQTPAPFELTASIADDPESLGGKIRGALGVVEKNQPNWRDARIAFNNWRAAIEQLGILVFQTGEVELGEMRGFSLSLSPLPVIVVNRKDPYVARCFTMLHEFAHLMLRTAGLCDLDNNPGRPPEEQRTEIFCNHVAGAALVPKVALLNEQILQRKDAPLLTDEELRELALHYSVSREVILRRFLIFGLIDESFYRQKREQYRKEHVRQPKQKGFVTPAVNAVSTLGKTFVRLVLSSYDSGRITTSDLSEYLGVRLKHIGKITEAIASE